MKSNFKFSFAAAEQRQQSKRRFFYFSKQKCFNYFKSVQKLQIYTQEDK